MRAWFKRILIVAAALIALARPWLALAGPPISTFEVQAGKATLQGVRYANPGGEPVILFHGLYETSYIWQAMAEALYEAGYDVWMPNFRGHGRGKQFSGIPKPKKGDYGFDEVFSQDVQATVDAVFARTGKRVNIVGHSAGGMTSKPYLSGIRIGAGGDGKTAVVPGLAESIATEKVAKFVAIGSPPELHELPLQLKVMGHVMDPFSSLISYANPLILPQLPTFGADRSPLEPEPQGLIAKARRAARVPLFKIAEAGMPIGLANRDNFDPNDHELQKMLEKGTSTINADYGGDFSRFARTGIITTRDGFYITANTRLYVPTMLVAGDLDTMARKEDIIREAQNIQANGDIELYIMDNTSHLDLVSGKRAARMLVPVLTGFFSRTTPLHVAPGSVVPTVIRDGQGCVNLGRTLEELGSAEVR